MRFEKFAMVFSVFLLAACNFTVTDPSVQVQTTSSSGSSSSSTSGTPVASLSCSATLPANSSGTTPSGQPTPILITVTSGSGTFQIAGLSTNFDVSTTIVRTYSNNTSANQIVNDTVQVLDDQGDTAQCNFTVTVLPATNPSTLGCSIQVSPASPTIGQQFFIVATGQGGTVPYSFNNLSLGVNGLETEPLEQVSSTQVSSAGRYTASGMKTVSIQVEDAESNIVTCTQSVNVLPLPSVTLTPAPSSSVPLNNSITLTANASGFASAPTYTFATTASGISLIAHANTVVVSVTDGVPHASVPVAVTALGANGFAAVNATTVSFTAIPVLNCGIYASPSQIIAGGSVTYSVSATQPLDITSFTPGSGGVVTAQTASSRTVQYSTSGVKTASVQAQSTSSGLQCNNGAPLDISINVVPYLSCSAYTNFNPACVGNDVLVYAQPLNAYGNAVIRSVQATYNGSTVQLPILGYQGNLGAYVTFPYPGVYTLKVNILDSSGASASCQTTEVIN